MLLKAVKDDLDQLGMKSVDGYFIIMVSRSKFAGHVCGDVDLAAAALSACMAEDDAIRDIVTKASQAYYDIIQSEEGEESQEGDAE